MVYNGLEKNLTVGANYFMAYHTVMKTSEDFYSALREARVIADDISLSLSTEGHQVEVFPYSVFYVFYEQYLTMWRDVLTSLGISVSAIFVVTFVLLGLNVHSSIVVLITILMIVTNMLGIMYFWDIPLNAVSLVNLVMVSYLRMFRIFSISHFILSAQAVGISVEFSSHLVRAFAVSLEPTRLARSREALVKMGTSVNFKFKSLL